MFFGPPETFSDRATSAQVLFLRQDVVRVPVAIGTADDSHRTPTDVPSLPTGEILIAYSYTGESARHKFDFSLNTQPVSGNCGWMTTSAFAAPSSAGHVIGETRPSNWPGRRRGSALRPAASASGQCDSTRPVAGSRINFEPRWSSRKSNIPLSFPAFASEESAPILPRSQLSSMKRRIDD